MSVSLIWITMDNIHKGTPISLVIDGASDDVTGPYQGADYWGNQWALARGIKTNRCHADWHRHGISAGPIRNVKMLEDQKPHLVVAFPGDKGTANMVKVAKAAGVKVREVK